tara:strand:- start:302 stop:511 length:210 start_codon:yes stop_codon:yes gene_type:complete
MQPFARYPVEIKLVSSCIGLQCSPTTEKLMGFKETSAKPAFKYSEAATGPWPNLRLFDASMAVGNAMLD